MTNNYFFSLIPINYQGNSNNFKTIEECYSTCKSGSNNIDVDSSKVDDDSNIDFHIKFEPSTHVPYVKPSYPDEYARETMPDSTVQHSGFVKNSN